MSADDQAFLDILSAVPQDVKRYSNEVASYIDRQADRVASSIRETLSSAQWIPESARPRPPRRPQTTSSSMARIIPISTFDQINTWVMNHKFLTSVLVIAVGGVTYHIIKRSTGRKKRRAKRASNGARTEVVVIAASPSEPITRALSLDLERRGFIVYVVCNTIEEEVLVQNESRSDIKSLMIDTVDPSSAQASIERFTQHLQIAHTAFQGAKHHHLIFRSLILIPSLTYPSSPVATLEPSTFSDLLNTRLLNPILTLQTFLPLLTSLPFSHLHSNPAAPSTPEKPSVLVLTPSIISSLTPAFHSPESLIVSALTSFASVLSSELSPISIPVTHLHLGTFDFSSFTPRTQLQSLRSQSGETLKWEASARHTYGRNFTHLTSGFLGASRGCGSSGNLGKGSSLRELNDVVFDLVEGRRKGGGIVYVGMGSRVYGFVGKWVPRGLVGWMLGLQKVGEEKEFGGLEGKGKERATSPKRTTTSPSRAFGSNVKRFDSDEYISVYDDEGAPKSWNFAP